MYVSTEYKRTSLAVSIIILFEEMGSTELLTFPLQSLLGFFTYYNKSAFILVFSNIIRKTIKVKSPGDLLETSNKR